MAKLKENMTFGECHSYMSMSTLGYLSRNKKKKKFTRLSYERAHESPENWYAAMPNVAASIPLLDGSIVTI